MTDNETLEKRLPDRVRTTPINWPEIFRRPHDFHLGIWGRDFILNQVNHENAIIDNYMNTNKVDYETAIRQLEESGEIFGRDRIEVGLPYITHGDIYYWRQDKIVPLCESVADRIVEAFESEKLKPAEIWVQMFSGDADHILYYGPSGFETIMYISGLLGKKLNDPRYRGSVGTFGGGTATNQLTGVVARMAYRLK